MKQSKHAVTLPPRSRQPNKAELEEQIKVHDVPGRNVREKMDNFASAIMRPAKIQYREK